MATAKEIIRVGEIEVRFLMDEEDTGGRHCVLEIVVPSGSRVPAPHYHEFVDELIYGLEGTLTFFVDNSPCEISPGSRCFIPRGVVHHFVNHSAHEARFLCVLTPALIGPAYFRDIAELINNGTPNPERIADVMRSHGLIVLPQTDSADSSKQSE